MSNYDAVAPAILSWTPDLPDVCGNRRLIHVFQKLVNRIRWLPDDETALSREHFIGLIVGESRTGKTCTVEAFVRTLVCQEIEADSLRPCHRCDACTTSWQTDGIRGLWSVLQGIARQRRVSISYTPIDCTRTTAADLAERLQIIEQDASHLRIIFLDEVHRLVKYHLDEKLLKVIEQTPAVWLLATAHPEELDDMLVKRCHTIPTEPPTTDEMAAWLAARCRDFKLPFTPDGLRRLVEKSNQVVGVARRCLAFAETLGEDVTLEFVDLDCAS